MHYFEEVKSRLFSLYVTKREMADDLEISAPAVWQALKAEKIPSNWLLTILMKKGVNPMWVLYGECHKKFLVESDEPVESDDPYGT